MFGSNPFVSSFAPQQGWGQPQNSAWSSNGTQNWGGSQPWSTANGSVNQQGASYNPYGPSYGGYGAGSYQNPTTDVYNPTSNGGMGSGSLPNYGNGPSSGINPYYYGQNPGVPGSYTTGGVDHYNMPGYLNPYQQQPPGSGGGGGGGSYGPTGWQPYGYTPPPGSPGYNTPYAAGGGGNNNNPLSRTGATLGQWPGSSSTPGSSTEPGNQFNPVQGSNLGIPGSPGATGSATPWSTTMMPDWTNTNNPNPATQFPAATHPQFIPDIIARMMYAQKGYTGNNGLYINPDGSFTF